MTAHTRLVLVALAFLGLAVFCAVRFEATTDITDFLDAPGSAVEGALSRRLSRSEATRTMVLSVSANDLSAALDAADVLAARLSDDPAVVWTAAGPDPNLPEILEAVYFDHRYQLWSEDPERELPAELSDAGLRAAAAELKRALGGPLAPMVRSVAPADPLLAYPTLVRRLQRASSPALQLREGQFVSRDGQSAIVFARTAYPALDSARHAPLFEHLEREFAALDEAAGGALQLELSSVQRFAVRTASAMRQDITRISALSTIGILLLFAIALRSPRLIAVSSLPLAAGLLSGLAACLWLYGRVNGLTLAFGGALVGVVIDYPLHLLAHWLTDGPAPDGTRALRKVWPGIRLGSATSFVGFAALAAAGFPGIREIGIFAGAGIAGAVLATVVVLPFLVPPRPPGAADTFAVGWANSLSELVDWLRARRRAAAVLPLAAGLICALGLPNARFTDQVSALSPVDPALVAEEKRVRDHVLGADASQMVIALGRDEEQALQRNDAVVALLQPLVESGALDGFQSLHDFLWSEALQRRNQETLASQPQLAGRALGALEAAGFRPQAFGPFADSLAASPEPLRLADLLHSELEHWVRPFLLPPDEDSDDPEARVAIATRVRGVSDKAALARTLSALDGVVFLDQFALLEAGYRGLREAALQTIALGGVAVLALLWFHYRSLAATGVALLPALLAVGTTAALISLAGQPLNLVHLFGLLLTMGMGVDYGVFLVESARQREAVGATALGLLLSCTTSVLGLGLLALSSNPGLRSLGVTTAIGVVSSLLLGPSVLALLGPRGDERLAS